MERCLHCNCLNEGPFVWIEPLDLDPFTLGDGTTEYRLSARLSFAQLPQGRPWCVGCVETLFPTEFASMLRIRDGRANPVKRSRLRPDPVPDVDASETDA